jgi:hypothetical protein
MTHLTFAWTIQLATGTAKPKTVSGASKSTKKAPTKATVKQKNTPKSAQRKVRLMFVLIGLLRQQIFYPDFRQGCINGMTSLPVSCRLTSLIMLPIFKPWYFAPLLIHYSASFVFVDAFSCCNFCA